MCMNCSVASILVYYPKREISKYRVYYQDIYISVMCYRYGLQRFSRVDKYYLRSESQRPLQRHDKLVLKFATNDLSFLSLLNGIEKKVPPKYHFSSLL